MGISGGTKMQTPPLWLIKGPGPRQAVTNWPWFPFGKLWRLFNLPPGEYRLDPIWENSGRQQSFGSSLKKTVCCNSHCLTDTHRHDPPSPSRVSSCAILDYQVCTCIIPLPQPQGLCTCCYYTWNSLPVCLGSVCPSCSSWFSSLGSLPDSSTLTYVPVSQHSAL